MERLISALVSRFTAADEKHPQGLLELKTQCLNPSVTVFPCAVPCFTGAGWGTRPLQEEKRKADTKEERSTWNPSSSSFAPFPLDVFLWASSISVFYEGTFVTVSYDLKKALHIDV